MKVCGLSPYWIDRSRAALNDFELDGIFLLTAPNMSGKSTLMRSILVAALLANCGLFVPCSTAQVPRYDHFFLRTSSHDVPSEGKSAFALEMEDMRIVLDDSSPNSLIMIDELGKIRHNSIQYDAIECSAIQNDAVQFSAIQYDTIRYSTMRVVHDTVVVYLLLDCHTSLTKLNIQSTHRQRNLCT